jgi:peroxin-10
LGEEYCDIMQISESTKQFPSTGVSTQSFFTLLSYIYVQHFNLLLLQKRATLMFWHVILPYLYTRGISELRKRTKPSWKKSLQKNQQIYNTKYDRLRDSIHQLLPKLQTFLKNHVNAIHLAIFYFFGAYYSLSKRAVGIRYVRMKYTFKGKMYFSNVISVNLLACQYRYLQDNLDLMNNVLDMKFLDFYS